MTKFLTIATLAATAMLASAASAQTLKPIKAEAIDLGSATHGSAYYVPEADGYHLVATLVAGNAQPVRFNAVLAEGQSASVSVPGPVGSAPEEVIFERSSAQLIVRQSRQSAAVTQ